MSALDRALAYYRQQQAVAIAAVKAARRQVREHPKDVQGLARTISGYQLVSATTASRTMAAEAGRTPYAVPLAFAGRTAAGTELTVPVRTLLDDLTVQLQAQAGALSEEMLKRIDRMVVSEVTDAGRGAASVEIVAEPVWTNYVRVLRPPSCARCAILAGRIYLDNEGFLRHPRCDCEHWPVSSWEEAHDEGLVFSAQALFDKGQLRGLSQAETSAIADGADIAKVVNSRSGMYTASIFGRDGVKLTSAGTTKRSEWRKANPNRQVRLRPESIYELAGGDKAEEIRLLKLYGYIRADADVPTDDGRGGGSGGGGRPPAPPADGDGDDDQPLQPHEAGFVRKMDDLNEVVQRLPLGARRPDGRGRVPSNDFRWVTNGGIHFELKSKIGTTGKLTYRKIRNTIFEAVVAAAEQGVVKENFIIDIGEKALRELLKRQLADYNRLRESTDGQIARLWVMTRGELVEIPLN